MRNKIIKKELVKKYDEIYAFGYCDIAYLEKEIKELGYNSGVNGWNYDAYEFYPIAITTGYRNMVSLNENKATRQALIDANEKIRQARFKYSFIGNDYKNEVGKILLELNDIVYKNINK